MKTNYWNEDKHWQSYQVGWGTIVIEELLTDHSGITEQGKT